MRLAYHPAFNCRAGVMRTFREFASSLAVHIQPPNNVRQHLLGRLKKVDLNLAQPHASHGRHQWSPSAALR